MSAGGGAVLWCELLREWAGELGRVWGGGCAESMPSCKEADAGVTRFQHVVVPSEFGRKLYVCGKKLPVFKVGNEFRTFVQNVQGSEIV